MFLYIILFKKADIIKIGISQTIDRIRQHTRTYKDIEPDLKNSYIVRASDQRDIKVLEQQLLQDYIDDSIKLDLGTRDGYTELRDSRILDSVLKDIESKVSKFPKKEMIINKGIKTLKSSPIYKNKKKKSEPLYKNDITSIRVPDEIVSTKYNMSSTSQKIALYLLGATKQKRNMSNNISILEAARYTGLDCTRLYKDAQDIIYELSNFKYIFEDGEYMLFQHCSYTSGTISFKLSDRVFLALSALDETALTFPSSTFGFCGQYSFKLYSLLKYRYTQSPTFVLNIEWFRYLFNLEDKYKNFTNLRRRVIETAIDDINKHSDLNVSVDTITNKRSVCAIRFEIQEKS